MTLPIAIGSDNATGKYKRPLSREIWQLFYSNKEKFNYTNE